MPTSPTNSASADQPLQILTEIMQRRGVTCSPEQFHEAVNVTFHNFEAEVYDEGHQDMWNSLPRQFELLAADCAQVFTGREKLALLDIGCGTGLASDSMLKSSLGSKIASVDLLDTSPQMLKHAIERAKTWGVPAESFQGIVEDLPASKTYDLIVTCSVLHHVPDLPSFLRAVRQLQQPGGVFIHIQDPNGDCLEDLELKRRTEAVNKKLVPEWAARYTPKRIWDRARREITGEQGQDFISKTTRELVRQHITQTPLTVAELYQITDIHVQDHTGVSIRQMKAWMPDYELISQRSYGFFGQLGSTLPPQFKAEEEALIARHALNGGHVGAAWRLTRA